MGALDIADTAKALASEVLSGRLALDSIDEYLFDNCHNLANQPSVDLLIRTGGSTEFPISYCGSRPMPSLFSETFFGPILMAKRLIVAYKSMLAAKDVLVRPPSK